MSEKTKWLRIALIAAICLIWTGEGRRALGKETAPKIGVVNITRVYDNYKKKRALEDDLRATREQKSRVIREKENEIQRLSDEIRMLELGSEVRKEKESQLEKKQVELRSFTEVTIGNMATQTRDSMEKLYSEVTAAVAEYGRKNGFDLIIKWEDVEIKSDTMEELLYKINQRTVLFASNTVDITEDVLTVLNSGYAREIVEK